MPYVGQQWQVSQEGGYLANPQLSKELRKAALPLLRFRQFVRPEPGFGKNRGDTVEILRVSEAQTKGGKLIEDQEVPVTKVLISKAQIKVDEYGNAIQYTGKLEALAEFDPENIIQDALRRDMAVVLDSVCAEAFLSTPYVYTPTGTTTNPSYTFSNNGQPGAVATRPIMAWDIRQIVRLMKSKLLRIPPYDGENYICITSIGGASAILEDKDFIEAAKYGDPEKLFSGELGRYHKVRFIEENNVLSDTLGNTQYAGEMVFFGHDPVVELVAVPEEIRVDVPRDMGRFKKLGWYYLGGFGLSFWESGAGLCRVIKVASATQ